MITQAAAVNGGRGSQPGPLQAHRLRRAARGRHPWWPGDRNGTQLLTGAGYVIDWRPSSAAAEDRNNAYKTLYLGGGAGWRSPFAAAEDRNQLGIGRAFVVTVVWRPPSVVAGDRNGTQLLVGPGYEVGWRSRSSATEDRNMLGEIGRYNEVVSMRPPLAAAGDRNGKKAGAGLAVLLELAAAARGGRGSQHPVPAAGDLVDGGSGGRR
jgi:hypothetical protein